jgi:hypothetical protein
MTYLDRLYYILHGDEIQAVDVLTWARWFETHFEDRVIARTIITPDIQVSTVFLGIDHNFCEVGSPIIFETMVFGGFLDQEQIRYATSAEAREGHRRMVARVTRAEAGESL